MQGGSAPATDGGERDDSQQQHGSPRPQNAQQSNRTGLMGITHRHDDALTHNPTPSEALVDRKDGSQMDRSVDASAATGKLGAAPSPLLRDSVASSASGSGGINGRGGSEQASSSSMPPAVLFPTTLFGEAAEPARAAPQCASSPQGTSPRRAYGGGSDGQCITVPISDKTDMPSSPDTSTSASPAQRKRCSSDGSNSSTLVEMLMRSSPSRLRPRVGTNEYVGESTLHIAKGDDDSSDAESEGERIVATSSKYDYDSSWNMVGNRVNMIGETEHSPTQAQECGAVSESSQPPGVLSAAVAASAAIAATVHSSDDSNQAIEGSTAANPGTRPITPPNNYIASSDQTSERPQQSNSSAHVNQSQSSVPASPILLVPRRRTRSTPNAGTTCYMATSPPIGSATRKRRDYAYQKYSTNDLRDVDSIEMNDGFDAVQNIDYSEPQEAAEVSSNENVSDNPFDDFDGTPVASRGGESVRSTSSSSSSSITHRRRRGHVAPGTTIFGGQSAQSVSSFSGSISTATASVQPLHGRSAHRIPSDHGSSPTQTSADSSHERNSAERSLRASLDAGMAAMRRWARSHAGVAGSAAASATQAGGRGPARSSRAATMQLSEEDVFALVNAGADPRRSISALEEDRDMRGVYDVGGLSVFAPIAEEDETSAAAAGRNRAFSEPDRARVRNFFSRRLFQNQGSPIQRSSSRQGRTSSGISPHDGTRSGQSSAQATAAQFGSNVISQMSSTDITAGARTLSSAAMSSSLFHSNSLPPHAAARAIGSGIDGRRSLDEVDLIESGSSPPQPPTEEIRASSRRQVEMDTTQDGIAPMTDGDQDIEAEERRRQQAASERQARRRWVRINQRFQVLITAVALIFSLILFAVLVCWIVLTSSYVVSIDKACDVPLKKYFWLATLQLVFDVFRTDIMRYALRWDPNSGQRIPARVILYNVAYLIYAICVLRIGVKSVYFSPESTCPDTAPEFYQAAAAFVTLSLAAWSTIVVGYLVPFCFVAIILTRNGYSPSADSNGEEAMNAAVGIPGVFPNAYANAGAPPECIDRLQVIMLHEFPDDYPRECCICMSDFSAGEVIVVTNCEHVFHKRCCQEWLQQARTCPVCRTDIPTALGMSEHGSDAGDSVDGESRPRPNRPPLNREEFHQEVVSLLRILRQHEERLRDRVTQQDREDEGDHMSASSDNVSLSRSFGGVAGTATGDIEENRMDSEEVRSMPNIRPRSE